MTMFFSNVLNEMNSICWRENIVTVEHKSRTDIHADTRYLFIDSPYSQHWNLEYVHVDNKLILGKTEIMDSETNGPRNILTTADSYRV